MGGCSRETLAAASDCTWRTKTLLVKFISPTLSSGKVLPLQIYLYLDELSHTSFTML